MISPNKLDVYHTTDNRGNFSDVIEWKGVYAYKNDLFLGKGYYYWEGCFDYAKHMGQTTYKNKYYIFNGILTIDYNKLLNLSINAHISFLLEQAKASRVNRKTLKLGLLIDFIRDKQIEALSKGEIKENELFFPFSYCIAIDNTKKPAEKIEFSSRIPNFINGKPESIICVYDKKDLCLEDFKLIKTENGS